MDLPFGMALFAGVAIWFISIELIDLIDELSGLEIDVTDPELKFVQRPLISWGLL